MNKLILPLTLLSSGVTYAQEVHVKDIQNAVLTCGMVYEIVAHNVSDVNIASELGEISNVYYDLYEGSGGDLFKSNRVAQEHALNAVQMLSFGLLEPSALSFGCNKAAGELIEVITKGGEW